MVCVLLRPLLLAQYKDVKFIPSPPDLGRLDPPEPPKYNDPSTKAVCTYHPAVRTEYPCVFL